MKPRIFEMLHDSRPDLAELGRDAKFIAPDAKAGALVHVEPRLFAENLKLRNH